MDIVRGSIAHYASAWSYQKMSGVGRPPAAKASSAPPAVKPVMGHVSLDHCIGTAGPHRHGRYEPWNASADRAEIEDGLQGQDPQLREIDGTNSVEDGQRQHVHGRPPPVNSRVVPARTAMLSLERAGDTTTIKASNGDITVGEVVPRNPSPSRPPRVQLVIGVREGGAVAWLDLSTSTGASANGLDATTGPSEADAKVEIRARPAPAATSPCGAPPFPHPVKTTPG